MTEKNQYPHTLENGDARVGGQLQVGDSIVIDDPDGGDPFILSVAEGELNLGEGVLVALDENGLIPGAYIPSYSITSVTVVDSEAEMIALDAQQGDVAIRTDLAGEAFIHNSGDAGNVTDWTPLQGATVTSVAGRTGSITLVIADVTGLQGVLDDKADITDLTDGLADKQDISEKGQASGYASLDAGGKLPTGQLPAHAHVVGDITGLSSSLSAKQETSEKGQANGYAELNSGGKLPSTQLPTHSHAIGDVTSLQSALDDKAPLASPALTGNPTAPSQSASDDSTKIATTAFVQALLAAVLRFEKIAGSISGAPTNSQEIFRFVVDGVNDPVTIPSGGTNSVAAAGTAATGSSVFSIKKNGTDFGTFTFAASATTATFSVSSSTALHPGDVITIIAPATADATLADIAWTIVGTI